jgi:hypothetical protein
MEVKPGSMAADGIRIETDSLTTLHWFAIALAALSGVIHLFLGVSGVTGTYISDQLGVAFLLAGLGFFGAVVLFLLDYRRRDLYLVGIPYTALQIVLYLWINQRVDPALSPTEAIDKAAQILLIVVLVVLYRRES